MAQQAASATRKTQDCRNDLFVSPDAIHDYLRNVFDLVSRHAYEIFERRGRIHGHDWDDWYQAESALFQTANHEVSDAGDAFLAVVDVRDYCPQDLKLSAEPRRLSICGLSAVGNNTAEESRRETTQPRAFSLSCSLPAPIEPEKASAEIRGDLLEVRLPKVILSDEDTRQGSAEDCVPSRKRIGFSEACQ
jgi:HSP20 family molecular chaperone IbpA